MKAWGASPSTRRRNWFGTAKRWHIFVNRAAAPRLINLPFDHVLGLARQAIVCRRFAVEKICITTRGKPGGFSLSSFNSGAMNQGANPPRRTRQLSTLNFHL